MSHSKKHEKDSQPVLPKLDQSLVVVKDLKDQPKSKFILLTGAARPTYYAVDGYREECAGVLMFYRNDPDSPFDIPVYTCRTEGIWALVNRDAVRVTDDRTLTIYQHEDAKVTEEFYESLDPKGWEESKKMAMASMGLGHLTEDKRPDVGQYL